MKASGIYLNTPRCDEVPAHTVHGHHMVMTGVTLHAASDDPLILQCFLQ